MNPHYIPDLLPAGKYLKPFQVPVVESMITFLQNRGSVYNACEMRLGKSAMTIAVANFFGWEKILVICPASVTYVWEKELKTFSTLKHPVDDKSLFNVISSQKDFNDANWNIPRVIILSYQLASSEKGIQWLTRTPMRFEAMVCDEAHYLKNRKTKRTKAILNELWPKIPKRICLSGTPLLAAVTDGFTLFNACAPEVFPNYWQFAKRYANEIRTPFGVQYVGIQREDELKALIRKNFFVRKTKAEVIDDLPPRDWQEILLPESYAVKNINDFNEEALRKEAATLEERLAKGLDITAIGSPAIKSLCQAQGIAKLPPVIEFIQDLLEQEIPLVVFAHNRSVIAALEKAFMHYSPSVIMGSVAPKDREERITAFQNGKTNLVIANIQAGGVGIKLDRADNAIFVQLDYSPANISQCAERIWSMDKKKAITLFYFQVEKSIEENIINILLTKVKAFEKVLK